MSGSFYIPPPYPFPTEWPRVFVSNENGNQPWLTPATIFGNYSLPVQQPTESDKTESTDFKTNYTDVSRCEEQGEEQMQDGEYRVYYLNV